MAGVKYFLFDLASGFRHVELTNSAKARSAFVAPFGHFEWNVMLFGLCNAPATFQRLMATVLEGVVPKLVMPSWTMLLPPLLLLEVSWRI